MKLRLKFGLMLLTLLTAVTLGPVTAFAGASQEAEMKELTQALIKRLPQAVNAKIKPTPVKGLYEVMTGSQIMYMTKDARFVFDGDLYDLQSKANLTENVRSGMRLDTLNALGEENMLVYQPKGEVKHTITIFTDIYCPYCRKLHDEMDDYMNNGVKVRYIFVPFKGAKSVETSVSVWCSKDKNKAMDLAKGGKSLDKLECDNPISKHQALASALEIRGTPAIMLESGKMLPGYVPSSKVIATLNGPL